MNNQWIEQLYTSRWKYMRTDNDTVARSGNPGYEPHSPLIAANGGDGKEMRAAPAPFVWMNGQCT
jgi:hypothetical protein